MNNYLFSSNQFSFPTNQYCLFQKFYCIIFFSCIFIISFLYGNMRCLVRTVCL